MIAAGWDAYVPRHCHALAPMGPGDKPRDDSGVHITVVRWRGEICEAGRVKPEGDNQGAVQLVRSRQQMRVIRNATTEFSI